MRDTDKTEKNVRATKCSVFKARKIKQKRCTFRLLWTLSPGTRRAYRKPSEVQRTSHALTEQRASASQMAAATVLETIPIFPGLASETSDAVSLHTQVWMNEALRLRLLAETERTQVGIRFRQQTWTTLMIQKATLVCGCSFLVLPKR